MANTGSTFHNIEYQYMGTRASLVSQTVRNLPAMWETQIGSLGWEDLLEKGIATHSSVLAWRIPWTDMLSHFSHVQLFATPWTVAYHLPATMGFPGKNTGVSCYFLLQEIFPTQGLNLGLTHCRQMLYRLRHKGSL